MADVRLRDGIHVDLATGETVVADARRPAGDVNVLSHAHGDHLYRRAPDRVVCSALTAALAAARRDGPPPERTTHPAVTLLNAGHVPGSRAAYLDDGETTVLYTGDVSTRDRFSLSGFDPRPADALVIETTYGRPGYVFPEQAALEREIVDWLDDTYDRPALLFGYALGRAQALQALVGRSERGRLFVTDATARVDRIVEDALGVDPMGTRRYDADVDLGPGDALVLPTGTGRSRFVESIVERTNAITAGFSGWAIDPSFVYRGGYDEGFVLSDHCDFEELVSVVEAVDPDVVYTHHGFADEFATHLTSEHGYEARALRRNQSTLDDF